MSSIDALNNHLQIVHNIDVVITRHTFGSFHHFLEWKEEEENLTDSWYVLHSAPNIRDSNAFIIITVIVLVNINLGVLGREH